MTKQRLDVAMVARGLAPSREKAQALIMAGEVKVASQRASKPSETVGEEDSIEVASPPPYVSRGGLKLAGALDHFGINPAGRICLDIGSSTGGFTDCLLQRGATRVHAVDVGTNQLDWRIRSHPRVVVHENVNARTLAFD
jgi:23S rRNA (cytidine1920-2'-O)/16S rRNA (cytidine1409-2'-O)-methyltransferase